MLARKIPALAKLPEIERAWIQQRWWEWLISNLKALRYSTYQPAILHSLEKALRRARLWFLKIDNLFERLIKNSRSTSEAWTIKSRAWMEHRRLKKREKTHVLEKLDKAEVSHEIEKIHQAMAKEEDAALLEKIDNLSEAVEIVQEMIEKTPEEALIEITEEAAHEAVEEVASVTPEEQQYIDQISENPKNIEAYRALGFIYLRQRNYSDARACFRRVLKHQPGDEAVKIKLEEIKGLRSVKKED